MLLEHPYIVFYAQNKRVSIAALTLAAHYSLGGRDALIVANFLMNKIPIMYTHDQELLKLKKLSWKNFEISFKDPLVEMTHNR